jgi:hypothetical protein
MQPQHDFLWRTTRNLQERERIGINRSAPETLVKRRGRHISTPL